VEHTANTKRVLRFVLRAVRNFIVEWAKPLGSVTVRGGAHIADRESENFSERVLWLRLICHVTEILRSKFEFFEQIDDWVPTEQVDSGGGSVGPGS
jgi:hypothetical protein